jgi:endonuclease YncB( thermonuclease family)
VAWPGVRCELDGERAHDRCVGICYLNGQDISEIIVRRGVARGYPRYSGGYYPATERQAAADGATIGLAYPPRCRLFAPAVIQRPGL